MSAPKRTANAKSGRVSGIFEIEDSVLEGVKEVVLNEVEFTCVLSVLQIHKKKSHFCI